MLCPACDDRQVGDLHHPCGMCGGHGRIPIDGCPYEMLDELTPLIIECGEFYKRGGLYAPGSISGQTNWYIEAMRYYRGEVAAWKSRLGAFGEE